MQPQERALLEQVARTPHLIQFLGLKRDEKDARRAAFVRGLRELLRHEHI
jgi:hypothetical protein